MSGIKTQQLPEMFKGITFKTMKIVIRDSKLRRSPVIKSLEILGYLSKENELDVIQKVKQLININHPNDLLHSEETNSVDKTVNVNTLAEDTNSTTRIPEEFLDSITQEMLVMPFTLPSGNVVDQSTIEKHNRNEESYGRWPCDPFTGVNYNCDSKPIFDAALKARLDEFKTKQCDLVEVRNSGRTIGKRHMYNSTPSTSSTLLPAEKSGHIAKKVKINGNNLDSVISGMYQSNQVSIFTKPRSSEPQKEIIRKCCKCLSEPNLNDNNFYRIRICNHEYCRNCLLEIANICHNCKISFDSSNVEKINF